MRPLPSHRQSLQEAHPRAPPSDKSDPEHIRRLELGPRRAPSASSAAPR
jgi:hypothetical protein